MAYLPAGDECDFEFDDDLDEYEYNHEPDLCALSSLHADVPLTDIDRVKSNCFISSSESKNGIMLLSDLQNAVISGNINTVNKFICNNPDHCNSILDSGWTPLTYACHFGHIDLVHLLLDAGANANLTGSDGCTPLMAACKCSNVLNLTTILKALLNNGADPLLQDKNRKTFLIHSVRSGKEGAVEIALQNSTEVINQKDSRGWTALDYAISKSFNDIIKLLVNNGADDYNSESNCISMLPINIQNSIHSLLKSVSSLEKSNINDNNISENIESNSYQDGDRSHGFNTSVSTSFQNEQVIAINLGGSGDSYKMYGQLELLLCGLDLSHLIPKFHEHDIHFDQLLCASNNDLIAIGIHQVGVRNRILTAIKDWHTTEWQESSLPNFSSTALTFSNLQALLRTSSDHLLYISSGLRYAKNQLKDYPQVLNPPASMQLHKNPDEAIMDQVEDLVLSTHKLCKSLKMLHHEAEIIKFKNLKQYQQVDCIKSNNIKRNHWWKTVLVVLPFLASSLFIIYRNNYAK